MIDQNRPLHADDGVTGLESELTLPTPECWLKLANVYAKVEFPPSSVEADGAGGVFRAGESR